MKERSKPLLIESSPPLLIKRETGSTILLPASLVRLGAELLFLAIAHGADAIWADSPIHQRLLGRVRSVLAQGEVIFRRSAVIAIAADNHLQSRMRGQEACVLRQNSLGVGTNLVAVVIEEGRLHILLEYLLLHGLSGLRRSRRRADRETGGRVRRTTPTPGHQVIGGRLGRGNVLRSVGVHCADAVNRDLSGIGRLPREHGASARADA